ncbi:hypothetical protein KR222_011675, partial [Zaprionus bogoriensis]
YTVELNKFDCKLVDPAMAHELTCILHRKRVYPGLTVRFSLTHAVSDFNILYSLDLFKKDGTKMSIAQAKIDGCKFLGHFYSNFMYGKFFKRIQSASNLPRKCPVAGNKLFEIHNYTVLAEEYPLGVPALKYQMRLKITMADRLTADIIVEGAVVY